MKRSQKVACRLLISFALILAIVVGIPEAALLESAVCLDAVEEQKDNDIVADEHQDDWWNILLLGGDSRSRSSYGRTDSMIVLSMNMKESKAKLTSIMRDTWVSFPGIDSHGKINAANVYGGPALAIATVNEHFGLDIKDYVLVNMAGLVEIIDLVGGIDIPVTESERKLINQYAKDYINNFGAYKGETSLKKAGNSVHLNGLLAMSYCRNRSIGTDYTRTQRQRTVLLAVLDKIKQGNAGQLMSVVMSAIKSVETNLTLAEFLKLATFGMNLDVSTIQQYRVPADGTFQSGMKNGVWSIRPNFEENKELLHSFIYEESQDD